MRGDDVERRNRAPVEEMEERLDAALRSYALPPEVPEAKVALAQMRQRLTAEEPGRGATRSASWWRWAGIAAGLACALALAILFWRAGDRQRPAIAWQPAAPRVVYLPPSTAKAIPAATRLQRVHAARRIRPKVSEQQLPKLDVFPTPRPLTPEEQALVAFAQYGPPAVRKAVLEDQKHWDDPTIAAESHEPSYQAASQQDQ